MTAREEAGLPAAPESKFCDVKECTSMHINHARLERAALDAVMVVAALAALPALVTAVQTEVSAAHHAQPAKSIAFPRVLLSPAPLQLPMARGLHAPHAF